nr:hypothetical protein [uncultured Tyzzerella sp.]
MEYFKIESFYEGFKYPEELLKIIELNLIDFDLWFICIETDFVEGWIKGLIERYPNRKLIPFAKRGDCDDIACFEIGKEGTVQIIHDFSSEGYEQRKEYKCFWDWFRDAIEEMIERYEEDKNY